MKKAPHNRQQWTNYEVKSRQIFWTAVFFCCLFGLLTNNNGTLQEFPLRIGYITLFHYEILFFSNFFAATL